MRLAFSVDYDCGWNHLQRFDSAMSTGSPAACRLFTDTTLGFGWCDGVLSQEWRSRQQSEPDER